VQCVAVMFVGILQSQLAKGSLSPSDVKASVCGLKEVVAGHSHTHRHNPTHC